MEKEPVKYRLLINQEHAANLQPDSTKGKIFEVIKALAEQINMPIVYISGEELEGITGKVVQTTEQEVNKPATTNPKKQ